uniref:Putative secreted protein n=1 Tax=Ixodes ricinus TaxID=34613 RepID=A0A147BE12_IXORI
MKMRARHHNYGAWNVLLTCLFSVLFHPCVESRPEVATNDVTKAGMSCCRMSRSWRSGVGVPAESTSQCERGRRCGVPTASRRSLRGPSSWRATCSTTGIWPIHHCCFTARVAAGDTSKTSSSRS